MKKFILKSQKGISLLEVVFAGALVLVIALAVTKITKDANKGITKIKTDDEMQNFKNFITSALKKRDQCKATYVTNGNRDIVNPNGQTKTDPVDQPQNIAPIPEYYEFSSEADAVSSSFRIVTAVNADGSERNSLVMLADTRIPGYPNWIFKEARMYQIGNETAGTQSGNCPLMIRLERDSRINSQRAFGSKDKIIWLNLNCTYAIAPPAAADRMEYCSDTQSFEGFWTLRPAPNPNQTIEYSGGVLVQDDATFNRDVIIERDITIKRHILLESDERLKKNISKIDGVTEKLKNVSGFYYFMRNEEYPDENFTHKRQIGVMAQEIERFFPEAVYTNDDGFKAVRYTMLIPILLEAHKEQESKIKNLEAEIQLIKELLKN